MTATKTEGETRKISNGRDEIDVVKTWDRGTGSDTSRGCERRWSGGRMRRKGAYSWEWEEQARALRTSFSQPTLWALSSLHTRTRDSASKPVNYFLCRAPPLLPSPSPARHLQERVVFAPAPNSSPSPFELDNLSTVFKGRRSS
eukprot:753779-Hanusia_phi.AAC.5